jgi:hypothetical protein
MRQITVRGITPELGRRLKRMSEAKNESLNTTVLGILRRAAGVEERRQALARYATWTDEDLREFEGALRAQRVIDAELWK